MVDARVYLQQLYCIDYDGIYHKISKPHPGTCVWLQQNNIFQSWIKGETSSLLFLYGFPGYGKTVLAKSVVQILRERTLSNSPFVSNTMRGSVVHHFCLDQDEKRKSSTFLLRSIIHQMVMIEPSLYKAILPYYTAMDWDFLSSSYTLWKIVKDMVSEIVSQPIYIVLDALDELSTDCKSEFLEQLVDLTSFLGRTGYRSPLKVFVTSRPEPLIKSLLSDSACKIELDTARNNEDLVSFVSTTVHEFATQNSFPSDLRDKICAEIIEKAQGMFLWASLAWESFKGSVAIWNQAAVGQQLKALQRLPSGLQPLYDRLLSQVNPRFVPELKRLFEWLVTAARPLSTAELAVVMAIHCHHKALSDVDMGFSIGEFIKQSCSNLVKVDDSGSVSLVHQSFKEYLTRKSEHFHSPATKSHQFQIDLGRAHSQALVSCFTYLCLDDITRLSERWPRGQVLREDAHARVKFCFLPYAALEWSLHLSLASDSDEVWLAFSRIKNLPPSWNLLCNFRIGLSFDGEENWELYNYGSATPLAIAVRSKFIIRKLVEAGTDINERWHGQTALFRCIRNTDMVDFLIGIKANPNVRDDSGSTPLLWATREHCLNIVKTLLKHPTVDRNMQDKDGRTALHWATRWDWTTVEAILDLLLGDDLIDVNLSDRDGRTPVAFAAYWGKEHAVKRLLRSPKLSLERGDVFGESPLICAAQQNWEAIVQGMVERVKNLSQHEDRDHRGIIHWTVINRWNEVLALVLNKPGCRINKIDARGMTALHYAAEEGNYSAARLLLKNGAIADIMDNTGKTPLHVAAKYCSTQILRLLLLERNLDVNEQDADGRTVMHWVAAVDSTPVVHLLLEQGADVNLRDQDGRTPLHVAVFCGCYQVLLVLLDSGELDVNKTDRSGNTILDLAMRMFSPSIVLDLRRRGCICSNYTPVLQSSVMYSSSTMEDKLQEQWDYRTDHTRSFNSTTTPYFERYASDPSSNHSSALVYFDIHHSFETWYPLYLKSNNIRRATCLGKLLDIYTTKIGSCKDYGTFLIKQMLDENGEYWCDVCRSDGAVCRDNSEVLRSAHSKYLYDLKYDQRNKELAKRNRTDDANETIES